MATTGNTVVPNDETEPAVKVEKGSSGATTSHDTTALGSASAPIILFKKEEGSDDEDYGKIDRSLPEAPEDNMFKEVDGEDEAQDEDEDELVDLTYEGIAHVNGVRHFVCEGFKIRQIPEPFIVKRSLLHLFQCIESKAIVLDPDYQREVVWDEPRAGQLVTSILMGYFIPPIIFNVKKDIIKVEGREKVKYTRTCVDGKQRLSSIWKFMSGQIGFYDSSSPQRKWHYSHPIVNGREIASDRNILPKAVKDFFQNQFFCCYEYEELTGDTEETMFQLVQRGIALTPAEKMRAMSTEWATFAKQYEDDYILIVNLAKQNRASGFRLVLTIFTMIQEVMANAKKTRKDKRAPILQASPQALLKVLEETSDINPALKLKMKEIFDRYEGLVKKCSSQHTATKFKVRMNTVFYPNPNFLQEPEIGHVRTFSPLELVVTAVLVAVHMDFRTDKQLLDDIKAMRIYLRIKHKDLRVNAGCWATSWHFITEMMDIRRGLKPATVTEALGDPKATLMQSIEGGGSAQLKDALPGRTTSRQFSDGESGLSSAPYSSDSDSDDEDSTLGSSLSDEDEDAHARPTRRTSRKRKAPPSKKKPAAKKRKLTHSKPAARSRTSARTTARISKKKKVKKPVKKKAKTTARRSRTKSVDVSFPQLDMSTPDLEARLGFRSRTRSVEVASPQPEISTPAPGIESASVQAVIQTN